MVECGTYNAKVPESLCAARYRKFHEEQDTSLILCGECETGKKNIDLIRPIRPIRPIGPIEKKKKGWTRKVPFFNKKSPADVFSEPEKRPGDDMPAVTAKKVCEVCGDEYKPTSNVQKRCPICAAKYKKPMHGIDPFDIPPEGHISPISEKSNREKKNNSNGSSDILQKLIDERNRLDEAIKVIEKYV